MYLKVFGLQTMTDISPGKKVPHLTGEMLILIPKNNKYTCLYKKNVVGSFTRCSHTFEGVFIYFPKFFCLCPGSKYVIPLSIFIPDISRHFQAFYLASSSLPQPPPVYSTPFLPIPAYSSLFPSIPTYSSLFQHSTAYSRIFQPIPVYSSLFNPPPHPLPHNT